MTRTLSIRSRRAAVVVLYGGYAAFAVIWHFRHVHSLALAIAALCGLVLSIAAGTWLFHRTAYWNWGHAPDKDLDEREKAERNLRYREAYSAFVGITFLALVYADIAPDFGGWLPDWKRDGQTILWCTLLVGLTLPSALLAWNDRTPVGEE